VNTKSCQSPRRLETQYRHERLPLGMLFEKINRCPEQMDKFPFFLALNIFQQPLMEFIGSKGEQGIHDLQHRYGLSRVQLLAFLLLIEWFRGEIRPMTPPHIQEVYRELNCPPILILALMKYGQRTREQLDDNFEAQGGIPRDPLMQDSQYTFSLYDLFWHEFYWYGQDVNDTFLERLSEKRQNCMNIATAQRIAHTILPGIINDRFGARYTPELSFGNFGSTLDICPWLPKAPGERTIGISGDIYDASTCPRFLWDTVSDRTVDVSTLDIMPKYRIISHTWGRFGKMDSEGRWITRNLESVPWAVPETTLFEVTDLPQILRKTRLGPDITHVWLDLVCIPQRGAPEEYSSLTIGEIAKQSFIFRRAYYPIVWLNTIENWDGAKAAIEWLSMQFVAHTNHSAREAIDDEVWLARLNFVKERAVKSGFGEVRLATHTSPQLPPATNYKDDSFMEDEPEGRVIMTVAIELMKPTVMVINSHAEAVMIMDLLFIPDNPFRRTPDSSSGLRTDTQVVAHRETGVLYNQEIIRGTAIIPGSGDRDFQRFNHISEAIDFILPRLLVNSDDGCAWAGSGNSRLVLIIDQMDAGYYFDMLTGTKTPTGSQLISKARFQSEAQVASLKQSSSCVGTAGPPSLDNLDFLDDILKAMNTVERSPENPEDLADILEGLAVSRSLEDSSNKRSNKRSSESLNNLVNPSKQLDTSRNIENTSINGSSPSHESPFLMSSQDSCTFTASQIDRVNPVETLDSGAVDTTETPLDTQPTPEEGRSISGTTSPAPILRDPLEVIVDIIQSIPNFAVVLEEQQGRIDRQKIRLEGNQGKEDICDSDDNLAILYSLGFDLPVAQAALSKENNADAAVDRITSTALDWIDKAPRDWVQDAVSNWFGVDPNWICRGQFEAETDERGQDDIEEVHKISAKHVMLLKSLGLPGFEKQEALLRRIFMRCMLLGDSDPPHDMQILNSLFRPTDLMAKEELDKAFERSPGETVGRRRENQKGKERAHTILPQLPGVSKPKVISTPEVKRNNGVIEVSPCGWFTSLWTLQEACLRPDMTLYNKSMEPLQIEGSRQTQLSVDSLGVLVKLWAGQLFHMGKAGGEKGAPSKVHIADTHVDFEDIPPAVQELFGVFTASGMIDLVDLSALDVISLGRQRMAEASRIPAIVSVLGLEKWYKEHAHEFAIDAPPQMLVHGLYPQSFLEEVRKLYGAKFFTASQNRARQYPLVPTKWHEQKEFPSISLPVVEATGTLLPIGENCKTGRWDSPSMVDHPSVASWVLSDDGSVILPYVGILASSWGKPTEIAIPAIVTLGLLDQNATIIRSEAPILDLHKFLVAFGDFSHTRVAAIVVRCSDSSLHRTEGIIMRPLFGTVTEAWVKIGTFYTKQDFLMLERLTYETFSAYRFKAKKYPHDIPTSERVDWIVL
jgi:hypothetical protein